MKNTFVVISSAGPNRDLSKGTREQPFWDEHAEFIDQLVAEGFILMGGPLVDEGGSLLIFNAEDENEVRDKMKNDPWAKQGILKLESVKRWQIFIDERKEYPMERIFTLIMIFHFSNWRAYAPRLLYSAPRRTN